MAKQFADPQIIVDTKLHVRYIEPAVVLARRSLKLGENPFFTVCGTVGQRDTGHASMSAAELTAAIDDCAQKAFRRTRIAIS